MNKSIVPDGMIIRLETKNGRVKFRAYGGNRRQKLALLCVGVRSILERTCAEGNEPLEEGIDMFANVLAEAMEADCTTTDTATIERMRKKYADD